MKKLIVVVILVVVLLAATTSTAQAREFEDATPLPTWATRYCIDVIYQIIQHESGNTKDDEIFQFITEQIIRDIQKYKCSGLTAWRWAIGNHLLEVNSQVKESVLKVLERYPKTLFPKCSFIGMLPDIQVWKSHGYNTEIGFEKTVGKLTVVGVDCDYVYRPPK